LARFVFAHPDAGTGAVQTASSLAVAAEHAVARRVAHGAHGGLLVLERQLNDKGKLSQDIAVENVRRTVTFFGSTAFEGGWRVAIIDAVDELNRFGANALLKILEEPPMRALLLLVSHAPGRVLPTIRSRCRRLLLRPLAVDDVCRAAAAARGCAADDADIRAAAELSDGSVARALSLVDGPLMALTKKTLGLLTQLPNPDQGALHGLSDMLGGNEPQSLAAFMDVVNRWLSGRVAAAVQDAGHAARLAEVWQRINRAAREVETYNLDRKPLVFSTFGLLAEAARG
jgi:DNA polymerase-3 subunit delta'